MGRKLQVSALSACAPRKRRADCSSRSSFGAPDLTTTSAGLSLFLTGRGGATRSKISATTLGSPELGWTDVISSHEKAVMSQAHSIGGGLLLIVFALDVGHEVRPLFLRFKLVS